MASLTEFVTQYALHPHVQEIVNEVETKTGKPIDFRSQPGLSAAATTKVARQRMSRHILIFDPAQAHRLNHLVPHECAHIFRLWDLPPEERLVPASEPANVMRAYQKVEPETAFLPLQLRAQLLCQWVHGLTLLVSNQPIDVRIERWLYETFPSLREEQEKSLVEDAEQIIKGLSPEVERLTPPTIFRAANAMNYAYLQCIGKLIGRSYSSKFIGQSEIISLGKELNAILTDDQPSDTAQVNRCAAKLGIQDWFIWRDFEDMPESYYEGIL